MNNALNITINNKVTDLLFLTIHEPFVEVCEILEMLRNDHKWS